MLLIQRRTAPRACQRAHGRGGVPKEHIPGSLLVAGDVSY